MCQRVIKNRAGPAGLRPAAFCAATKHRAGATPPQSTGRTGREPHHHKAPEAPGGSHATTKHRALAWWLQRRGWCVGPPACAGGFVGNELGTATKHRALAWWLTARMARRPAGLRPAAFCAHPTKHRALARWPAAASAPASSRRLATPRTPAHRRLHGLSTIAPLARPRVSAAEFR
jgi:hypothetical protein